MVSRVRLGAARWSLPSRPMVRAARGLREVNHALEQIRSEGDISGIPGVALCAIDRLGAIDDRQAPFVGVRVTTGAALGFRRFAAASVRSACWHRVRIPTHPERRRQGLAWRSSDERIARILWNDRRPCDAARGRAGHAFAVAWAKVSVAWNVQPRHASDRSVCGSAPSRRLSQSFTPRQATGTERTSPGADASGSRLCRGAAFVSRSKPCQ
jgi:hypothetical protein